MSPVGLYVQHGGRNPGSQARETSSLMAAVTSRGRCYTLRTAYRSIPVRQQDACLTQNLRKVSNCFFICVVNVHSCGHWSLLSRLLYWLTLNTPACLDLGYQFSNMNWALGTFPRKAQIRSLKADSSGQTWSKPVYYKAKLETVPCHEEMWGPRTS